MNPIFWAKGNAISKKITIFVSYKNKNMVTISLIILIQAEP